MGFSSVGTPWASGLLECFGLLKIRLTGGGHGQMISSAVGQGLLKINLLPGCRSMMPSSSSAGVGEGLLSPQQILKASKKLYQYINFLRSS